MLAPVMTLDEGARIYSPGGQLLAEDDRLEQPGLVAALEALAREGAASVYTGSIAEALLALMDDRGGCVTRADLDRYRAEWSDPVAVDYAGTRLLTREGLSAVPATAERLPRFRGRSERDRALGWAEALGPDPSGSPGTRRTSAWSTRTGARAC